MLTPQPLWASHHESQQPSRALRLTAALVRAALEPVNTLQAGGQNDGLEALPDQWHVPLMKSL